MVLGGRLKTPRIPPAYGDLVREIAPERLEHILLASVETLPGGRYRHWERLQFLAPPPGLTHKEWWLALKLTRRQGLKSLPLLDKAGHPFRFGMPDPVLEMVHRIDRDASGQISLSEEVTNPETRNRYIVHSLIEEAIASSQLEGAATSHRIAKQMLRTGREPRDRSERMIVNNFRAMQAISGEHCRSPLTPEVICAIHRHVTDGTLDDPQMAGTFRTPSDEISVWDQRDGTLLHEPPDASELPGRIRAMCDFANGTTPATYVHPVIRAIALHFWLGYDHPFVDGNGRTARALFYWSMLRQGYWLAEFIYISGILRRAPARYMRAYLYSESDENDLTYFLLFHLDVVQRAILELNRYLKRKMSEIRETKQILRRIEEFNPRQIALLTHALNHGEFEYTIQSHRISHNVVYQTARADLLDLEKRELLDRVKRRRQFVFVAPWNLASRLKKRGPRK